MMARVRELAGLNITQCTSPNSGGAMSAHRGIVLHIAQGTYRGTISWQMDPAQRYADGTRVTTSSTWIVGTERGEWAQMVDTDRIAWCQRDGSRTWLSIELAGWAPHPPSEWQVEACAQLLAWAHREHGIPLAVADHPGQRGLGHHSMDREWEGEEWGHEACPGAGVIAAKPAIVARAKQIVEGDDMPLTKDDAKTVWMSDIVPAPQGYDATANPTWQPANMLRSAHLYSRLGYQWAKQNGGLLEAVLAAVTGQDVVEAAKEGARAGVREGTLQAIAEATDEIVARLTDVPPDQVAKAVEQAVEKVLGRARLTVADQ